jgi:hypothetical protein
MTDDILKAVPKDLQDTYDYTVGTDTLGDSNMTNDVRAIVRTCTLGQALVELKKKRPDIKVLIKMPVPRKRPWHTFPMLLVGGRPPPGTLIRLSDVACANLEVLLRACGVGGIEPFTLMRGDGWLEELGREIGESYTTSGQPDITFEELEKAVREWKDRWR